VDALNKHNKNSCSAAREQRNKCPLCSSRCPLQRVEHASKAQQEFRRRRGTSGSALQTAASHLHSCHCAARATRLSNVSRESIGLRERACTDLSNTRSRAHCLYATDTCCWQRAVPPA